MQEKGGTKELLAMTSALWAGTKGVHANDFCSQFHMAS